MKASEAATILRQEGIPPKAVRVFEAMMEDLRGSKKAMRDMLEHLTLLAEAVQELSTGFGVLSKEIEVSQGKLRKSKKANEQFLSEDIDDVEGNG
jgi:archaellum component FlaC